MPKAIITTKQAGRLAAAESSTPRSELGSVGDAAGAEVGSASSVGGVLGVSSIGTGAEVGSAPTVGGVLGVGSIGTGDEVGSAPSVVGMLGDGSIETGDEVGSAPSEVGRGAVLGMRDGSCVGRLLTVGSIVVGARVGEPVGGAMTGPVSMLHKLPELLSSDPQ